jgi:release factor glutamine methyltransferase
MAKQTAVAPPPTLGEALRWARERIDPLEARVLLAHAAGFRVATLLAYPERPLPELAWQRFCALVARRVAGEPVAYLTGEREFYGRSFLVTPAVLIPRPDTETLVEVALAVADQRGGEPLRILDLGTGSGCIAITLALELPNAEVVAVDRSRAALSVARNNAERLGASVSFVESDWYTRLGDDHFDLIVANPPYLAEEDPHLAAGDLRFEPKEALIGGRSGTAMLRRIVAEAPRYLTPGGWLLVEHGADQGRFVRGLLLDAGFLAVQTQCDLAGHERVSGGRKRRDDE